MTANLVLLLLTMTPPTSKGDEFATIDGTIAAVSDVLSGPVEKERDWDRFHSIFAPGAMMRTLVPKKDGPARLIEMTPAAYVEYGKRIFKQGPFYESEISRKEEVFGHIANVWSTYEIKREPKGKPVVRGINNITLRFDGMRWWVVGILWQQESPDFPIPQKYLPD